MFLKRAPTARTGTFREACCPPPGNTGGGGPSGVHPSCELRKALPAHPELVCVLEEGSPWPGSQRLVTTTRMPTGSCRTRLDPPPTAPAVQASLVGRAMRDTVTRRLLTGHRAEQAAGFLSPLRMASGSGTLTDASRRASMPRTTLIGRVSLILPP